MINKITPETTVAEICEVLEFIEKKYIFNSRLIIYSDISGDFQLDNGCYNKKHLCIIKDLSEYIKDRQKELTANKLKNMTEDEFNKYITDSLVDPEKMKVLYDNIKEVLK